LAQAIGFAQAGLLPICEIPYAKYLDCGYDQLEEACSNYWLSAGRIPNGMVVRLQGFDRGVFGGNFHTHNTLHCPPGLDLVAYSNGADYVRGWRYCLAQAAAGRVVMTVDSTALLNQRHVLDKDGGWQRAFPDATSAPLSFDEVMCYRGADTGRTRVTATWGEGGVVDGSMPFSATAGSVAIVTYGNGVPLALRSVWTQLPPAQAAQVIIVDCPYLSHPPEGLRQLLREGAFGAVVFADVCKEGVGAPLSSHAVRRGFWPMFPETAGLMTGKRLSIRTDGDGWVVSAGCAPERGVATAAVVVCRGAACLQPSRLDGHLPVRVPGVRGRHAPARAGRPRGEALPHAEAGDGRAQELPGGHDRAPTARRSAGEASQAQTLPEWSHGALAPSE
jgi:hypothetical protein